MLNSKKLKMINKELSIKLKDVPEDSTWLRDLLLPWEVKIKGGDNLSSHWINSLKLSLVMCF